MKQIIYADNAATTRIDDSVFNAMKRFLLEEYGNPSQPYSLSRVTKKAIKDAREAIASCIGARPDEIYFTSGGTESDNWAIIGSAFCDVKKRAVLTSAFEHHAILHSCAAIEHLGYPVAYMQPTKNGYITPEILENYITDSTRLVSVMTANNEIGTIQPIQELAQVSHAHGAFFHTDAVQAIGHIEINVEMLGVDMLSASAHKFNGPKGVGFLYIRKGTPIVSLLDGGAQENGFRAGTENVAAIVGMAAALKENIDNLDENISHVRELEAALLTALANAGIEFNRNGMAPILPGLLSLSFPGRSGETILHRMDLMGICISTGSACDSVNTEISHVLQAIQLDKSLAMGTIRISLGKHNTLEEVQKIVAALLKIVKP